MKRRGADLFVRIATWVLAACLSVVSAAGAAAQDAAPTPTPPAAPTVPSETVQAEPDLPSVPVIYRGHEIWRIRTPLGPFSAEDRARAAAARIEAVVNDASIQPDELTVIHGATASQIVLRDRVVGVMTDEDAAAAGLPRREMVERGLEDIKQLIVSTREEYTARAVARGVLWALLVTLVCGALLMATLRAFRRILRAAHEWRSRPVTELAGPREGAARLAALAGRPLAALVTPGLRLVRAVALVALALFWLEAVLAALPWSRPHARQLIDYVEEPLLYVWHGFLDLLPNLFYLLVIWAVAHSALWVIRSIFTEIGRGTVRLANFPAEWAGPTYRLVRVLLVALAVVAAYPYIPGSSSPAFQGISVFLGLLLSLSSSSAIGNIVAGTVLTYTGAFRTDDRVQIGDTTGDIVETSMLVTKVRTIKNVQVAIPNAIVLSSSIVNYSALARDQGLILHTGVTIGYDAPWRQIHDLLIAAALRTKGILDVPRPFVLQTALNDFYVAYEINAFTRLPHQMVDIYSELHAHIQDAFNEAGVEIMSPHYGALRDGNHIAIPDAYVAPDYEAKRFRVSTAGETPPPRSDT